MKLIIQPDDGVTPILSAIKSAKQRIDIAIFRADRKDFENALKAAAARGVKVTALIAYLNRGGTDSLRKLELRFLDAGIIVARTDRKLIRYHDKFIVIDRRVLFVLSFNFTHLDIDYSRGFGIITSSPEWVREGVRLFRADCTRSSFEPRVETFVVSPTNSRKALAEFLKRAKKQLLIYDPNISDKEMLRVLEDRARAGVEIRIIGRVDGRYKFTQQRLAQRRLHTRTIIRDRRQAFIGSQSLRPLELDARRELGLIVRDAGVIKRLVETFESDWEAAAKKKEGASTKAIDELPQVEKIENQDLEREHQEQAEKQVEVAVETFKHEINPLATTVKKAVRKAVAKAGDDVLKDKVVKDTMKKVVKKAVKEAVKEAVQESSNK